METTFSRERVAYTGGDKTARVVGWIDTTARMLLLVGVILGGAALISSVNATLATTLHPQQEMLNG